MTYRCPERPFQTIAVNDRFVAFGGKWALFMIRWQRRETEERRARWTGGSLMPIDLLSALRPVGLAGNKEGIVEQKRSLLPQHVWSIRVRPEMAGNTRDLAQFNMAVDSKLR